MELQLLAASLRSRQDYELIKQYIDTKLSTYSKPWQVVMNKLGEFYQRDSNAQAVDAEVLLAQLSETIRNEKHIQRFTELVNESLANTSSDANVRAAILMAKVQEAGDKLTQSMLMGRDDVDDLLLEVQHLRSLTSLDDLSEQGLELYHDINLLELVATESDPTSLIKVYPMSLNERLDGGAKRGHHLLIYAPVEAGKSATCINMNCGFARQGFRSLYFINEDRPQDIILRHVSNLSGMNKREIYAQPERAQHLANEAGFQNIMVVSCSPGTPRQIEHYIEKYSPDCIIVDQLRNLQMKAESRVNQLEAAATAVRNIGKKHNVLAVSVTQAGDSATDKLILRMGDVDFSNVGIPSQADVMIGIGMDPTYEAEGLRHMSLPKNKLSGRHEDWPVRINTQLSRITSV